MNQYRSMSKKDGESQYLPIVVDELILDAAHLVLAANRYGLTQLTFKPRQGDNWHEREVQLTQSDESDKVLAKQHLSQAKQELQDYFLGKLTRFSVPLAPVGTEFQHRVWQVLLSKPFGEACSYSDIANEIDNPKAVRAVGTANGANHIPIIIPCHRIIGKSGTLTGYAYGLELKQQLLTLEGVNS